MRRKEVQRISRTGSPRGFMGKLQRPAKGNEMFTKNAAPAIIVGILLLAACGGDLPLPWLRDDGVPAGGWAE